MAPKYHLVKRITLTCLLALSFFVLHAQKEDSVDTSVIQDREASPPDDADSYKTYTDTPVIKKSIYFIDKRLQSNGGGPGEVQARKLPDSTLKKLKADGDFWYVNYAFDK